jgi:hypothetical protein
VKAVVMDGGLLTLAVLRHRDGWRVFGPNGGWRTFAYRVDAEEAALRLASQAVGDTGPIHVLVQDPSGELRPLDGAASGLHS